MGKYKKFYGVIVFLIIVVASVFFAVTEIQKKYNESTQLDTTIENSKKDLRELQGKKKIVDEKLAKIKDSILGAPKKIYAPVESGLDDDSLFFTLYNDALDMVTSNGIKIKSIKPVFDSINDPFVNEGNKNGDNYYVCDVTMDLISNYINLGKLVQDIYSYPSYIRINSLDIEPYNKDKKILLSKLSLRLYARTSPIEEEDLVGDIDAALGN